MPRYPSLFQMNIRALRLLQVLRQTPVLRDGAWSQIQPQPAWSGNWTSDDFICLRLGR